MKKMIFKVSIIDKISSIDIMKECNKFTCRVLIDFKDNLVIAENLEDNIIDKVIDLVNKYFDIVAVYINNTIRSDNAIFIEQTTESAISIEDSKNAEVSKKTRDGKTALMETVGNAFDNLDSSKPVSEQIDSFLSDIGMTTDERMIKQSFYIACDIKKITYENVVLELHNIYPEMNKTTIMITLKENFRKWLKNYPELAKKCPKISFMSVLKLFAKKFT